MSRWPGTPFEAAMLQKQARHLGVLDLAAEKAGCSKPLPKEMGRGIAAHFAFGSHSTHLAEVSVTDGKVRVHRLVCAIDCGQYVNPGIIAAQSVAKKWNLSQAGIPLGH